MNQLTAFQRDVLYVIGELGDPHGLAIKNELEAYYESEVNHGRLYPNSDELVEHEFINKTKKDDRTNEHQLTAHAREAIQQRREWENIDRIL